MTHSRKFKFRALLAIYAAIFILCGCSKDDGPDPPVPVPDPQPIPVVMGECFSEQKIYIPFCHIWKVPSNVTFDRVEAEITGIDHKVIGTVAGWLENGEIVLELPTGYTPEELCKVARNDIYYDDVKQRYIFDYEGFWPATTDNPNAKVAGLGDMFAYDGEERVGRIFLSDWSGTGSATGKGWVYFHYTDQPFKLSGYNQTIPGERKSYVYEASFSPGWNSYLNIDVSGGGVTRCTTAIEEDFELYWRFESYVY